MKHPVLKGLLATFAAVALTATPAFAGPDAPNRGRFAALGDSYAAGVGNATLIKNSGMSGRTAEAYPVLLAGATNKVTFLAASGATTSDVMAQVAMVPSTATQVTVTVGGNDVGFVDVATACAAGESTDCGAAIHAASAAVGTLPSSVAGVVGAIKTKAPGATVYVTGYPHLFQPTGNPFEGYTCTALPMYDANAMAAFDAATYNPLTTDIDSVNEAIAAGAMYAGATYVDVTLAFAGHGLCDGDKSWTQGPMDLAPLHPTSQGQRAYAGAIKAAGFVTP